MKNLFFLVTLLAASAVHAINIQQVQTPTGLSAWLVEDHTLPVVRMQLTFRAGSAFDPPKQFGLSAYTASLLNEGAGDLDAQSFRNALAELGSQFGVNSDQLYITANLTTLQENLPQTLALASKALTQPHFDDAALERVRGQHLQALQRRAEDPGDVASDAFLKALFGQHPYAHTSLGIDRELRRFTKTDVQRFFRNNIQQSNLTISVVGAISAEELAPMLDEAFGKIPNTNPVNYIAQKPLPVMASNIIIPREVNQANILIGQLGISRADPDYYSAFVLNHILGGSALNSRLGEVVRKQNGLAYSVNSAFIPLPKQGYFLVSLQTKTESAQQAIDLVKQEISDIRTAPVTAEELADAKSYLIDSFPLRLDSSSKILGYLSVMQQEKLGADYLDNWPKKIAKLTAEELLQTAQERLTPDNLLVVQVGASN